MFEGELAVVALLVVGVSGGAPLHADARFVLALDLVEGDVGLGFVLDGLALDGGVELFEFGLDFLLLDFDFVLELFEFAHLAQGGDVAAGLAELDRGGAGGAFLLADEDGGEDGEDDDVGGG